MFIDNSKTDFFKQILSYFFKQNTLILNDCNSKAFLKEINYL